MANIDRSGFCVTCQKNFQNRYDHAKKNPGHVVSKNTEPAASAGAAEPEAEDVLSAAADEQAKAKPTRKMNGADFASQPLFVATAGVGLGILTARALGPDNALRQEEAQGIAAGLLRIAGRHLLKEVDMGALAEANGDIQDAMLIVRAVSNYIARKWSEGQQRRDNESAGQAGPATRPSAPQQNGRGGPQSRSSDSMEAEAVMMQQQWAAGVFNLPDFGSEAA